MNRCISSEMLIKWIEEKRAELNEWSISYDDVMGVYDNLIAAINSGELDATNMSIKNLAALLGVTPLPGESEEALRLRLLEVQRSIARQSLDDMVSVLGEYRLPGENDTDLRNRLLQKYPPNKQNTPPA